MGRAKVEAPGSSRRRGRRDGEREFDASYPTQALMRVVRGKSLEDLTETGLKQALGLTQLLRLRLERELEDMPAEGSGDTLILGSRRVSEGWTRKFQTYTSATAKLAGQAIAWEAVKEKKLSGFTLEELEEMVAAGEKDKAGSKEPAG